LFEVISTTNEKAWLKDVEYKLCTSVAEFKEYTSIARCREVAKGVIGGDFETNGKNVEKSKPVCFTVSLEPKKAIYYPIGHRIGNDLNLPFDELVAHMRALDEAGIITVYHSYKFDGEVWIRATNGAWMPVNFDDSLILAYLENPNLNQYGLKECIPRYFGIQPLEFAETVGNRTFDLIHPTDGLDYACQDSDFARRIRFLPQVQQVVLKEQEFIHKMEKMAVQEVRQGEMNKVFLSKAKLLELKSDVERRVGPLLAEIYELAGGEFLVDSPVKLGARLEQLGIPFTEKERTGKTKQPSTGKEVLQKYAKEFPICAKVVQYKELTTQCRNYIDKMIGAVEHFGYAVRFPFHQVGVPTGRMKAGGEGSIQEAFEKGVMPVNVQSLPDHEKQDYLPNIRSAIVSNPPTGRETLETIPLQNIPAYGDKPARDITIKFKNEGDFVIVAADYSQVELRIAANMARESAWIKTFSDPKGDIHLTNAQLAYRDYKMSKNDARRKRGKTISFAILYGGSEYTVAQHGNIPVEQGKILVDNFFAGAPQLKAWIDSWIKMARQQKFVKTTFGRRRPLSEFYTGESFIDRNGMHRPKDRSVNWLWQKGDREAVNDPIQGGAADIFKLGMIKLGKMIRAKNWQQDVQQILWIHDEFVLRVRRSMLHEIVPEVIKTLEFEVKNWPVQLKTDVEVGWNWGEMIPWSTYQQLGLPSLSLVPWKSIEDRYKDYGGFDKVGSAVLEVLESEGTKESPIEARDTEEDDEQHAQQSYDRSEFGF
jgi:DNA polymerase-1